MAAATVFFVAVRVDGALDPAKSITQYVHDVWSVDNGLPQDSVLAMAQTPDGYLWLGTEEGIARFDGARFVTFDKRNTRSLQGDEVDALAVDRRGTLWIGMRGGGLVSYASGEFRAYTAKDGLSNDSVQALYADDRGDLWVGTDGGGLNRLHNGKFSVYTRKDGLGDDAVFSVCGDRAGGVWIATHGGLSHWSKGRLVNLTERDGLPSDDIRSLYADGPGTVWMGTNGAGVAHLAGGGITRYTARDGLSDNHIWSIVNDSAGSLWFGTGGGGVTRLHAGKFSRYGHADGLSGDEVWAMAQDGEGSLWIGSSGGLNRLRNASFTTYGMQDGLASDGILGIYQDREGAIWMGTDDGGVDRFENGKVTHFTVKQGLADNQVFSITEDGRGDHWFGTRLGLNRLSKGKIAVYTTRDGLPHNFIRCTFTDRKGDLWIGSREGLTHFDGRHFTTYGTKDGLADPHVLAIAEDARDGALWIGTGGGLYHFANGAFRGYTKEDGLSNGVVLAIYAEPDGTVWLGTNGGGLTRLRKGRFASFGSRTGLLDDTVEQILDDGRGNLWLSGDRGIARIAKNELDALAEGRIQTLSPETFGAADGMRSRECNGGFQPAGWRLRDGQLAFPTTKGVALVDPAHLVSNRTGPNVLIERMVADGREIGKQGAVDLAPGRGQFEIQYTATSFIQPNKVRFKYMLEGFDKDWTDAGTRRTAFYTNIPAGKYRFRVTGCNADGVWAAQEAGVAFTLRPHFYETLPFAGGVGLGLLGLIAAAYRLRVNQLHTRQRRLEKLVQERTEELSKSERKFRELAENIREVFWMMDPETGSLLYVSPAFDELWGFPSAGILNDAAAWFTAIHGEDAETVRDLRLRQRRGERSDCEYRIVAGGRCRWVWDRAFPILDQSGRLSRIVGIVEDITDRKTAEQVLRRSNEDLEQRVGDRTAELLSLNEALRLENLERRRTEEQLKAAKEAAEAGSRAKSEFLANMSHELRTPMNGILGMTGLALSTQSDCERKDYLEIVNHSANSLLTIIDDILDFSRAEARKVVLRRVPFRVREVFTKTIDSLSAQATGKGLALSQEIDSGVPENVMGDPERLRQVLVNLAGNALKFTAAGRVTVSVRAIARDTAGVSLEFCVKDTGIGIPEEKRACIFEAFTQVDGSFTREFGGTGLGLAISSQLVELMGGKIWVESEVGTGSKFYFSAMFGTPEKANGGAGSQAEGNGDKQPTPQNRALDLLLAEDNLVNQRVAVRLLEKHGHRVTVAANGREALTALEQHDWKFDAVFMDIQMPEMDGIAATAEIRRLEPLGRAHLPVIALTAHALESDRERCLAAGMDRHLAKPIQMEALLCLLRDIAAGTIAVEASRSEV